uniref:Uncharacterized protein n=1 Tax=Anguilla anguilla TaxID=7936 RepID=A0A0E9RTP2_ANGAN
MNVYCTINSGLVSSSCVVLFNVIFSHILCLIKIRSEKQEKLNLKNCQ